MKTIAIIAVLLISELGFSQNWQTYSIQDFGEPFGSWWAELDGYDRGFIIDPQNNSIWMLRPDRLTMIDDNGVYVNTDLSSHPTLPNGHYVEVSINDQYLYLIDRNSGLYRYDGSVWGQQASFAWGKDISWDLDTMLIGITSQNPSALVSPSGVFQYEQFDADRVRSKNGITWYTNGGGIPYRYYSGQYGSPVVSDTSLLLDNVIHDFKFSPYSDSLFVAGDLGFSIANSTHFVDTITQFNTINMPVGAVEQFEFDTNGNIWALFQEGNYHSDLAFLDRGTMTWTQVYDESNSPINFPTNAALELDTFGNIWVAENNKLHSLTIAMDSVSWLGVQEGIINQIQVFPNPSNGIVNFNIDPAIKIEIIEILDLSGSLVKTMPFEKSINCAFDPGTYFIQLKNGSSIVATRKHIVH